MGRRARAGKTENQKRVSRGRVREDASFPAASPRAKMPGDYAEVLGTLKERIRRERLKTVLAANAAMVILYWDIGREILVRQNQAGWGAKIIDRLAVDLRAAFPDMRGFSPRNLKYMRAFAAAWPEREFVQEALAQIPWYQNIALIEKLDSSEQRLWYARQTALNGWSQAILVLQIDGRVRFPRNRRPAPRGGSGTGVDGPCAALSVGVGSRFCFCGTPGSSGGGRSGLLC